jgi:hypothetical protein
MLTPAVCGALAGLMCLWSLEPSAAAPLPTPAEVLEHMRVADNSFATGLTISGRSTRIPNRLNPELGPYDIAFSLTQNAEEEAFVFHATELPRTGDAHIFEDTPAGRERGWTSPFLKTWVYGGPEQQGESHVDANHIEPEDSLQDLLDTPGRRNAQITIAPPKPHKSPHITRTLRAIGRGFTDDAVECTTVAPASDGMLQVTLMTSHGEWKLLVDPSLNYMAREGLYTKDGDDNPSIQTKNTGLVATGVPVPTQATYEDIKSMYLGEHPYEIEHAVLEADEALLREARDALSPDAFPDMHVLVEDIRSPGITRSLTREPHGTLKRIASTQETQGQTTGFVCLGGVMRHAAAAPAPEAGRQTENEEKRVVCPSI